MTNYEIYKNVFLDIFNSSDIEKIKYGDNGWNSASHLILITELENAFDISLEIKDILIFESFAVGIDILKKYNINI